jgi:hypothetical protein
MYTVLKVDKCWIFTVSDYNLLRFCVRRVTRLEIRGGNDFDHPRGPAVADTKDKKT